MPRNFSKRQKTDHQIELCLANPKIKNDAKILRILQSNATAGLLSGVHADPYRPSPTLYSRYRGTKFPITQPNRNKLPPWRSLSSWMKLQIATLVLAERHYMNFTTHLHDDRYRELVAKGESPKDYLRDGMTRRLRGMFGADRPGFLFVMEDMDVTGQTVRPHAHGSIEVPRIDISHAPRGKRKLARMVAQGKEHEAELIVGRMVIRQLLKAASGNGRRSARVSSSGVHQTRNVWTKQPTFVLQTHHWLDYAFKNTVRFSADLGEGREALSTSLRRQAQDLWEIVRNGDKAIAKVVKRNASRP